MGIKQFFVFALIFATMFSFVSTCNANQVGLTSVTKEKFMSDIKAVLNQDDIKKDAALVIGDLERHEKQDKENFKFLAWHAFFGPVGSENPCGELIFFVDENNYVNTIQVSWLKSGNPNEYLAIMSAILLPMGLTTDNVAHLLKDGEKDEDNMVWSAVQNYEPGKHLLLMTMEDDELRLAVVMANDGKQ